MVNRTRNMVYECYAVYLGRCPFLIQWTRDEIIYCSKWLSERETVVLRVRLSPWVKSLAQEENLLLETLSSQHCPEYRKTIGVSHP
jgi:hypothetical protein